MFNIRKKLTISDKSELARVKISSLSSYSLLYSPIYLYLEKNEKYLAVKEPFDFFSDSDLQKLAPFGVFFVPKFVHSLNRIITIAEIAKDLLEKKSATTLRSKMDPNFEVFLPKAPFELSDILLKLLGPLWGKVSEEEVGIEPFTIAIFVNELLNDIPKDILSKTGKTKKDLFDWGILVSSVAVFFALHLGYYDYAFLQELRLKILKQILELEVDAEYHVEIAESIKLVEKILKETSLACIGSGRILQNTSRVSIKLVGRLRRIIEEQHINNNGPLKFFGDGGPTDAV